MPRGHFAKDMVGERHNHLVVLKKHHEKYRGQAMWVCKCDCGKIVPVPGGDLRRGYVVKCGRDCPKFGVIKGEAAFNYIYSGYVKGTKKRNIDWKLSKGEFRKLTSEDCYYCGCSPNQRTYRQDLNGDYIYNGIDRVNNSVGYTVKNCVPCCWRCNRCKGTLSSKEFKKFILEVYSHWAFK